MHSVETQLSTLPSLQVSLIIWQVRSKRALGSSENGGVISKSVQTSNLAAESSFETKKDLKSPNSSVLELVIFQTANFLHPK